jgi:hypothetical protein
MSKRYGVQRIIDALRQHHGLISLAADELHCDRQTIYNYVERYPAVAQVLSEERERLIDLAEHSLYLQVQEGAPWAVSLVLRTIGRRRGYGDGPAAADVPAESHADDIVDIGSPNGHHPL